LLDFQLNLIKIHDMKKFGVFKLRLSGERLYHHIYARGNDRHPIFKSQVHYVKYLQLLSYYSKFCRIDIIAYALMEWHVHIFVYDHCNRISEFMSNLHGDYARFYNRTSERIGHVFGERFQNKIVQPNVYGLWLSRYVHRQAVEAGLVSNPKDYPWTSYRAYLGMEKNVLLKPEIILGQFGEDPVARSRYEDFVMDDDDGPVNWKSSKQVVIGEEEFVEKFEGVENRGMDENSGRPAAIEFASEQMGFNTQQLLRPQGREQRQRRWELIKRLVMEYGYTRSEIAQAFGISVTAVANALKGGVR
jgi:REP element-mobilizing transposase RayT